MEIIFGCARRRIGSSAGSSSDKIFAIAGIIAAQVFCAYNLQDYLNYIVLGAAAIFLMLFSIWIIRARRRMLARRKDRYRISPMSRDELNKARSKLVNNKR